MLTISSYSGTSPNKRTPTAAKVIIYITKRPKKMTKSCIMWITISIIGPNVSVSWNIINSLAQKKKATAATRKSKLKDSSWIWSSIAWRNIYAGVGGVFKPKPSLLIFLYSRCFINQMRTARAAPTSIKWLARHENFLLVKWQNIRLVTIWIGNEKATYPKYWALSIKLTTLSTSILSLI